MLIAKEQRWIQNLREVETRIPPMQVMTGGNASSFHEEKSSRSNIAPKLSSIEGGTDMIMFPSRQSTLIRG